MPLVTGLRLAKGRNRTKHLNLGALYASNSSRYVIYEE